MIDASDVAGAVLCGGASSRMGRDKATIELPDGLLAGRSRTALRTAGIDVVLAVGGDATRLGTRGFLAVEDRWPGEGPLGGIITALSSAPEPASVVVVTAGDLVRPTAALVDLVVAVRHRADADAALTTVGGRVQWLFGAWHRRAVGTLEEAFGAGVRAVHRAVAGLDIAFVPDDGGLSAVDADVPDDLR